MAEKLDFLTNEPVEGELLSELLALGPLTAEEALQYALEVGASLQKAHSAGQVHGGLSPQCVVITESGARLARPEVPTLASAPYRAPEQVRGGRADWRSDIFSYGTVLYEMVSGRKPFPGEGAELDEQITSRPAPSLGMEGPIPAAIEGVIAGCLEKDPARRRQRIQNAIIELKLVARSASRGTAVGPRPVVRRPVAAPMAAPASTAEPAPATSSWKPSLPSFPKWRQASAPQHAPAGGYVAYGSQAWATPANLFKRRAGIIGIGVLAVAATSVAAVFYLHQRPAQPVLRFAVTQPEHTSYPGMPAVSPDGRYLTFSAAGPEGKRLLWLRPLDALHATVIPGTEGGAAPFWSPNSQFIGFFANKSLKKVRINGGTPELICGSEATPGGGTWNRDDVILFAPGMADGLYKVPAGGGKPQPVLRLDPAKAERAYLWPQFLPDGKHFIFYAYTDNSETSGVYTSALEGGQSNRLFASQTNAVYSATADGDARNGYLLYMVERSLTAVPFNASRMETTGDAITLATDIGSLRSLSLAPISVSNNAVLVYQGVGAPSRQLVWTDRGGRQLAQAGEPGEWGPPRISPDGTRAVAGKLASDGKTSHLWILDSNGVATQITDGPYQDSYPVWSPDGARIAHQTKQENEYVVYVRPASPGSRADTIFRSVSPYPGKLLSDWSRDGRYLLFGMPGEGTHLDLWGISMADRRAGPIVNTVYDEGYAAVSPDGHWLAYQSSQIGSRFEVYIQPMDGIVNGTKRRWQISKGGGGLPRWRADSAELYFMTSDGRMMASSIRGGETEGTLEAGNPTLLFQTRPLPKTWNLYDVGPDGQKFLLNLPLEWSSTGPIMVVTNWTEKLKE